MADEGQLRQETERARKAQLILDSPLWQETWGAMREHYLSALVESPISDMDAVKDIKVTIRLLDQLRRVFEEHVITGKMASKQLEELHNGRRSSGT